MRSSPGILACLTPLVPAIIAACGQGGACGSAPEQAAERPLAPPEPVAAPEFPHQSFPDAAAAVGHLLERTAPRVVGFGEYHQLEETAGIMSTLERFRRHILPALAPTASDLIVETWVSEGGCGPAEQQVVSQVDQVTERPAATEDETVALLRTAMSLGLAPHILELDCDAYERLLEPDGGLDFLAMLELVGGALERKGLAVLEARENDPRLVLMLGGAAHNDSSPSELWRSISYGPGLSERTGGRYLEIDLLVPEFVERSRLARDEPWFPLLARLAAPDRTWLVELAPDSFIVIMERGVAGGGGSDGGEERPGTP